MSRIKDLSHMKHVPMVMCMSIHICTQIPKQLNSISNRLKKFILMNHVMMAHDVEKVSSTPNTLVIQFS